MSDSPLVTSGLCFYNPHITAWKAGPEYRLPWDPASNSVWQLLANRSLARVASIMIFLSSQEH
jgi:hypothetical protein